MWCKYTADDDIGKYCSVGVNREILRIGCKHSVPKTKRELRYNGLQSGPKNGNFRHLKIAFFLLLCFFTRFLHRIDHFTVVCYVAWPMNESEAGGDLVLIETPCFSYVNKTPGGVNVGCIG